MSARASLASGALLLGVFAASCEPARAPSAPPGAQAPAPQRVELRLLYTSDEHGWIAPASEKGRARGGAAELLARWRQQEGHCVPGPSDACEGGGTLALSGGDNWTGPALSSFFQGEPGAEALRRLGYAASALGNHELDFGRGAFEKNALIEGFPYLGANVTPPLAEGGVTRPYALFKRRGVVVGVVGLSTRETIKVGLRDNYRGLQFGDEEKALEESVPAAYGAGADVVVVIGHVCGDELKKIVARHPDWRLAFAGGGHCHRSTQQQVFTTPILEVGSFLRSYGRVSLTIDPGRPARERVVETRVEVVDLTYPEGSAPPVEPDAELRALVAGWQQKADAALGEVLGHSDEALEADSPPLANFITDRWREATGSDVAILNRFGTRQALPKGPITLGTIYSVLPFNNRLVTVRVTGEQLVHDVNCCGGHVSGVKGSAGGLVLASGKPIDPAARYTVVGTDFTYYGGSDFPFEKQDPSPTFGDDWRAPLIAWLRKNPTAPGRGLEKLVDREPRVRGKK